VLLSGGLAELTRMPGTLDLVNILGYPSYVLIILGAWKLAATAALLAPGVPRLKEWAYAGVFFNMTGAAASHAFVGDYGDYAFHIVVTLSFAALAVLSLKLLPWRTEQQLSVVYA
jgi:heme A synthase